MIQFLHSYWAYLVLLVLVLATANALFKFFANKEYDPKDFRISLFSLITMHIQLLMGMILYFTKGYFDENSISIYHCMRYPFEFLTCFLNCAISF